MSKTATLLIVFVLIFLIIGVVAFLFLNSNKKQTQQVTQTNKESTGVSNLLANSGNSLPVILKAFGL
jgi:hypothetical protein